MNNSFLANAKSAPLESFLPISAGFIGWEARTKAVASWSWSVQHRKLHIWATGHPQRLVITVVLNLACLLESPGELCKSPDAQTLFQSCYIRASLSEQPSLSINELPHI